MKAPETPSQIWGERKLDIALANLVVSPQIWAWEELSSERFLHLMSVACSILLTATTEATAQRDNGTKIGKANSPSFFV